MTQDSRRCSARRKDGQPCRAWAVRDSEPALCPTHRKTHQAQQDQPSFIASVVDDDEAADLLYESADKDLREELNKTQLVVRRLLAQLRDELDGAEYARLIVLFYQGANTNPDTMRVRRAPPKKDNDRSSKLFTEITKQLKKEKGWDL